MKKVTNTPEDLIARYLNQGCDEEEVLELLRWINESEQNKSEYISLKDIWDSSIQVTDHTENQLALFYKGQYLTSRKSRRLYVGFSVAVAAILLLALVIDIFIPRIADRRNNGVQVVSVPLGSRSKVILADGTQVNLNSGSELRYSNLFSSQNRAVTLSGEAYFDVKSDTKHPFIVSTKNFDVKVTGTRFNVMAYSDDNENTTTLEEGKITLQLLGNSNSIDIQPGKRFSFDKNGQKYSLNTADVEQEISWKDGEFVFKSIKFLDLARRLERWYDVKLSFSDARLTTLVYSGRFKNQETIWQVLDALSLTSPVDYKRKSFREFEIIYKPN
ncbi:MAG: FecR domain-containing protein [Prolixibacteraceae bacterium]